MPVSRGLEIRRSSASLHGGETALRETPVVSKYIDTTTCIGCKACEVACQEWNDLGIVPTAQLGSYQTMPTLHAEFWNLIRFHEQELEPSYRSSALGLPPSSLDSGLAWLMRKDQCMHCEDPGCLAACPAPGAIVQYQNGIVDVNAEQCIGCGMCQTGCPFDVPRFDDNTRKMSKCTLCVDRVDVGLEPACIKACPTGCLQFGTKADMLSLAEHRVDQLKQNGFSQALAYDPKGVGGTGVVTVVAYGDHLDWYGLPADPKIPAAISIAKHVLRPFGLFAIAAAFLAALFHYLWYGPKKEDA